MIFQEARPYARRWWRHLRPRAAILAYHRIADVAFDPYGQAVSPANLEQQLAYLGQHAQIVSLEALLEQLQRGQLVDRTVAITFDDGYADNLYTAYPLLERLSVPMTVFVTVQPIRTGTPFWWDALAQAVYARPLSPEPFILGPGQSATWLLASEPDRLRVLGQLQAWFRMQNEAARSSALDALRRPMPPSTVAMDMGRPLTVAELRQFAALPGVTMGSHTMTHTRLANLPVSEQRRELSDSKTYLEQALGYPVTMMAYPFGKAGDLSSVTRWLAARVGYRVALTTMPRAATWPVSRYALSRLTVHNWPKAEFAQRLSQLWGRAP